MSYKNDLAYAEANLGAVRRMLATTVSPIVRRNLQSRIPELEEKVQLAEQQLEHFAEVDLLFDGGPVRAQVGIEAGFAGDGLAGVGFAALGCTTAGVAGSIAATISGSCTIGARGSLTTGAELPPNWPMAQTDPAASATTPSKMATTIRFIRVSLKGVSKV
jgi:hypothetical protein